MKNHRRAILIAPVPLWVLVAVVVAAAAITLAVGYVAWGDRETVIAAPPASDDATTTPPADEASDPVIDPEPEDWRDAEYRKIGQLRAGLSLAWFEHLLGPPMFVTPSQDRMFTQYLYRGRDHWVQAIADNDGSVRLMTITSCDEQFRPTFAGELGSIPNMGGIILHQTRFDEVPASPPTRVRYATSIATANSYYFDEYYLGNPGNYKTYFVGITDACPWLAPARTEIPLFERGVEYAADDPDVIAFRAEAIANTYGETDIFFQEEVLASFQIGADRILTRTAPAYPDE
jgi:hypothetical protein